MPHSIPMTDFDVSSIQERLDELKATGATEIRVWHNYFQNFEWQRGIHEDGHMSVRLHHLLISDKHINREEEKFPITVTAQELYDNAWDAEALSGDFEEVESLPVDYAEDGTPVWDDDHLEIIMTVSKPKLSKFNLEEADGVTVFKMIDPAHLGLYRMRFTSLDELRKVIGD